MLTVWLFCTCIFFKYLEGPITRKQYENKISIIIVKYKNIINENKYQYENNLVFYFIPRLEKNIGKNSKHFLIKIYIFIFNSINIYVNPRYNFFSVKKNIFTCGQIPVIPDIWCHFHRFPVSSWIICFRNRSCHFL